MVRRTTICLAFALALVSLHPWSAIAAFDDRNADTISSESRIEPFHAVSATDSAIGPSHLQCSPDGTWCAHISTDEQADLWLIVLRGGSEGTQLGEIGRYRLDVGMTDATLTLWSHIVRTPSVGKEREETALLGVETTVTTMYSGGGAGATQLNLIQVDPTYSEIFRDVLSVPLSGWALIRACFSEDHVEQRAGACHDEYDFAAELTLRRASTGSVEFEYATTATSFPGPVSRTADSLTSAPLTEEDLLHVVNERCSYRRVVRFNAATERFEFDSPAPDCSDFTAP